MSDLDRTLAAILSADAVGYSRLMARDEVDTVATLDACRAIFREVIEGRKGRVVDTAGDSVLAVFGSVVEAVTSAAEIQGRIGAHNQDRADDRRMLFRIGINLGDVITKADGTVYGDGVNVAARLESLADAGGINLSGTAYDQVDGKLDLRFAYQGEKEVKNIDRKVRVYKAELDGAPTPAASSETSEAKIPSIAVLPFDNLSGDQEQEYFADGVCEDLITELSRLRWLSVIARNTTFTFKGKAVDVKAVGRDLGVRYVVEGSVRRGGDRVRITAQLIDTETGTHIWAERYDREFSDVFALQDEITATLVATLEREVGVVERDRAHRKPPESLDAWETYQRGMWYCWKLAPDQLAEAERLLLRATEMDPDFAQAVACLAYVRYAKVFMGWETGEPLTKLTSALDNARRAIDLDDKNAMAHMALGRVHLIMGKYDEAVTAMERAIALNPSLTLAYFGLGMTFAFAEQPEKAIASLDKAIEFSPHDPALFAFLTVRSFALMGLEDYESAVEYARRAVAEQSAYVLPHAALVAALGWLGRKAEAKQAIDEMLEAHPDFSPRKSLANLSPLNPDEVMPVMQPWIEGLRKAGLEIPDDS
jgi:TolB-like protein